MRFEFATAAEIRFGEGVSRDLPECTARWGRRVLLVTGRSGRGRDLLGGAGLEVASISIGGEPAVGEVVRVAREARERGTDVVVAVGGGSVLDAGKAVAAFLTNPGDPFEYLEVIGRGSPLPVAAAPVIAVPTTAGTGSEVTRNAVLASPEHRVKVSLRHPSMLPRVAFVDPELTYTCPPEVTAGSGLDALTQLVEPFVSNAPNPITDSLCRDGIRRAATALSRAYRNGEDREARRDMALASLFGGLALANARLGAVHGIAGPLGGMFPAPHGPVCARLLPEVMQTNLQALRDREPGSPVLGRYDEVGRLLTGRSDRQAHDGIESIRELAEQMNIPGLSRWGVSEADLLEIAAKARRAGSMKGNPVELTDEELLGILRRAL